MSWTSEVELMWSLNKSEPSTEVSEEACSCCTPSETWTNLSRMLAIRCATSEMGRGYDEKGGRFCSRFAVDSVVGLLDLWLLLDSWLLSTGC